MWNLMENPLSATALNTSCEKCGAKIGTVTVAQDEAPGGAATTYVFVCGAIVEWEKSDDSWNIVEACE